MFITTPDLEVNVPKGLAEPGSRFWMAALLSTEAPWFLVTHFLTTERVPQTVVVAWETTLIDLVETVQSHAVIGLSRVAATPSPGNWKMTAIDELWLPSVIEADQAGPLLFRIMGEADLRDSFMKQARADVVGRRLLLRVKSGFADPRASAREAEWND